MTVADFRDALYQTAVERFNAVPEAIREDLVEALIWARDTLRDKEGAGHDFQLSPDGVNEGTMCCSFAKPEWPGDHCGPYRGQASHAVIMAVCTYLCGV
jgi:hypothetical protein